MPNLTGSIARARRATRRRLAPSLALAALATLAACASSPAAAPASAPTSATTSGAGSPPPARVGVLSTYAGHPLAVFPLQHVTGDSLAAPDSLRAQFDAAFADAARSAGAATGWAMAAELQRSARRNPGFVPDPRTLTIAGLGAVRPGDGISAALAGEVRSTVALHDARFAVVPRLLRLTSAGDTHTATLSLVLLDSRLARVGWRGDVAADGPSAAAAVTAAAGRAVALFVAP